VGAHSCGSVTIDLPWISDSEVFRWKEIIGK